MDPTLTYYETMATRGRLLGLMEGDEIRLLITFFVLPHEKAVPLYAQRPYWTTPTDLADGPVLYLDLMTGRAFHTHDVQTLADSFTERVPSWDRAVWTRPGPQADRWRTYRRRRPHGSDV